MSFRKKVSSITILVLLIVTFSVSALAQEEALSTTAYPLPEAAPDEILIRNATIWTQESAGRLAATDLLIRDGRIASIGKGLSAAAGALVIDAQGKHVTPGLIDAHSHAAVEGFGVNEGANSVTAEVRVADVLDPTDRFIYLQAAGGLTAANVLHGSANSIGGQNAVIKMRWGVEEPEDLLIDTAPAGIKFALGENPKRSNVPSLPGLPQRYPQSRMGVAATIRNALRDAADYRHQWDHYNSLSETEKARQVPPRKSLQMEALAEILEGKRLVHSHSYRADEILMLIRLADDAGFKIQTFQHVLEGYRVADEIAAHGAGASTFSDWWAYKQEAYEAIPYNAAIMEARDVLVSLNSDNPNLARRMNIEAAKTIRFGGLSPQDALALVTINPARQLRIDDRTGSLKEGKDGDVVIWNGDPLSVFSSVDYTLVDGRIIFNRERDHAHRQAQADARAALVDMIKNEGKKKEEEKESESTEEESATEEEGAQESETESAETPEEIPANPAAPVVEYQLSRSANQRPVAIVGATVHTLEGEAIPNGVVVFDKGRITAVGNRRTRIPGNAHRVDARGKHLWPGMIQMQSVLGLSEIDSVAGTVDTGEMGDWNSNIDAVVAVHAASEHIPVTRSGGVTHAVVAPDGGTVAGNSSVVRMDGWTWEEMAAVPRHSLVVQWGAPTSPFAAFFGGGQSIKDRKKTAEEKQKELTEFFDNAELYGKAKQQAEADGKPWTVDPQLEAMAPVIGGDRPLYVIASDGWAIRQAVDWALGRGLRLVIIGGDGAVEIAGYLAERQVPVVLTNVTGPPGTDEPYDVTYSKAGKLAQAGVLVAIAGSDTPGGSSNSRNIPGFAGVAAAFGLDRQEAYRTVTLNPARMLGLDKELGSIAVGKSASLVLTDGDLLEPGTNIEQVWIDGDQPPSGDKHKDLYRKYSSRPTPR